MTPAAFKRTLSHAVPPKHLSPALKALWWARKGEWQTAHRIVMNDATPEAAWVHAHLHRVEGDDGNACYWYRQAKRKPVNVTCEAEWEAIVAALL